MRQTSVNRRKGRQGSVIIESALIFVVFAGMLIGAMDFAQFLFIHQALVERARYAARWGAIQDATDEELGEMLKYLRTIGKSPLKREKPH